MSFKDLGYQPRPHHQFWVMAYQISPNQEFVSFERSESKGGAGTASCGPRDLEDPHLGEFLYDHKMLGFSNP